jgi:hypothetical protein
MIAGAANQIMKPRALAAQHDDKIASEVEPVVVGCAAFVETNDPEILALEFFESAHQINHARDAQMLGRTRAGLHGNGAQRGGAALSEDDAVDARAIGHAQQRAQVLRIFYAIESQNEARCGGVFDGRGEEIFEGKEFL